MESKKFLKLSYLSGGVILACACLWFGLKMTDSAETPPAAPETQKAPAAAPAQQQARPKYVRGIHLTAWVTGSPKMRAAIDTLIDETELNTVVIDIKEYEGEVYIPGVKLADDHKVFVRAIPDLADYVAKLKQKGVYTIARIVVFKDNLIPRKMPGLAVKTPEGELWKDRRGITWLDPYNKEAWDYNLDIAERAVELGFEEIQFDYIRFPSDGNVKTCRYVQKHSSTSSSGALVGFLEAAHHRLKPRGVMLSIDVFGLTTTVTHDMGIGQRINEMAKWVDFVSPMVYPSHYAKGEYGIAEPNKEPYKTVYLGMAGAKKRMGAAAVKLRPYLQDFSLGHRYGAKEVEAQIQATYDNDIGDWLLWNPRCVYTRAALKSKKFSDTYERSKILPVTLETKKSSSDKKSKAVFPSTGIPSALPLSGGPLTSIAAQPETAVSSGTTATPAQ